MANESELLKIKSIESSLEIIYGLDINPMLDELLDQIAIDVSWLCHRLELAWSTISAYQEEISYFYGD